MYIWQAKPVGKLYLVEVLLFCKISFSSKSYPSGTAKVRSMLVVREAWVAVVESAIGLMLLSSSFLEAA